MSVEPLHTQQDDIDVAEATFGHNNVEAAQALATIAVARRLDRVVDLLETVAYAQAAQATRQKMSGVDIQHQADRLAARWPNLYAQKPE